MADIKLKIQSSLEQDGKSVEMVTLYNLNSETNKAVVSNTSIKTYDKSISEGTFISIPSGSKNTANGLSFALGELCFNGNDNLDNIVNSDAVLESEKNSDVYIFGATDENGYEPVYLDIYGNTLQYIVIYGDEKTGQYPIEAIVNGKPVTNSGYAFEIQCDPALFFQTIDITKWSKPNYNAVITGIEVFSGEVWVDIRSGLKKIETLSQSTGQPKEIYYGGVASRGSAEIFDKNKNIQDFIEKGIISNSNTVVEVWANGRKVAEKKALDSNYENQNFSIEFGDTITQLSNTQVLLRSMEEINAYDLLMETLSQTNVRKYDLSTQIKYFDGYTTVENYLKKIKLANIHSQATAEQILNDLCTATQLNYFEKEGTLVFVSARPRTHKEEVHPIQIPKKYCYNTPSRDILLKNKYSQIEIPITNLSMTEREQPTTAYTDIIRQNLSNQIVVSTDGYINNAQDLVKEKYDATQGITYGGKSYFVKETITQAQYIITGARIDFYVHKGSFTIPYAEYPRGYFDTTKKQYKNSYSVYKYNVDVFDNQNNTNELRNRMSIRENWGERNNPFTLYNKATLESTNASLFDGGEPTSDGETAFLYVPIYRKTINNNNVTALLTANIPSRLHSPQFKITEKEQGYLCEYEAYVGKIEAYVNLAGFTNSSSGTPPTFIKDVDVHGWDYNSIKIYQVPDITFYIPKAGKPFDVESDEAVQVVINPNVNFTNSFSYPKSEYMQGKIVMNNLDGTTKEFTASIKQSNDADYPLFQYMAENVGDDYNNGISTAKLISICADLYDENGTKIKDWSKGETYEVGDIVQVNKDNNGNSLWTYANKEPMLWRVTGRNFHKEGVPLVDLELQEVK